MVPFKIDNWLITSEGIEWTGAYGRELFIPVNRIAEPGPPTSRTHMYDWLVHLPSKTWMTVQDVYALNTAIIYALEEFGIGFSPSLSFVETLIEQQKEIAEKSSADEEGEIEM